MTNSALRAIDSDESYNPSTTGWWHRAGRTCLTRSSPTSNDPPAAANVNRHRFGPVRAGTGRVGLARIRRARGGDRQAENDGRVSAAGRWGAFASVGIPILSDLNGIQTDVDYRVVAGIGVGF